MEIGGGRKNWVRESMRSPPQFVARAYRSRGRTTRATVATVERECEAINVGRRVRHGKVIVDAERTRIPAGDVLATVLGRMERVMRGKLIGRGSRRYGKAALPLHGRRDLW